MPKSTQLDRCTAQYEYRSFCDRESLPGAPFPICLIHAAELMAFLRDVSPGTMQASTDAAAVEVDARRQADEYGEVIYYLRVADLVKIGHTTDLRKRLLSYPPHSELLAVEPGDRDAERARHAQFAEALTLRKEWFIQTPALLQHIAALRPTGVTLEPAGS